jgi:hypothetical protein
VPLEIVHVPATIPYDTVPVPDPPEDANVIVSPKIADDADVMEIADWFAFETTKDCCSSPAAKKLVSPAWDAVMTQVPAPTIVKTEPETEQMLTSAVVSDTCSPELAVAEIENGASPYVRPLNEPKVIV